MKITRWIKYHKRPIIIILVLVISIVIIYNIGYVFGANRAHKLYELSQVEKRVEKLLCKIIQTSFRKDRYPHGLVGYHSQAQNMEVLLINNMNVYPKVEYFTSNDIQEMRKSYREPIKRMGIMMDWKSDQDEVKVRKMIEGWKKAKEERHDK